MNRALPFLLAGLSIPLAMASASSQSAPRFWKEMIFSPDGASLVTITGCDAAAGPGCTDVIRLWDAGTFKLRAVLDIVTGTPEKGRPLPGSATAFSPDGKYLATGGWEGTVKLWDAATGRPVATLVKGNLNVACVSERVWTPKLRFSPDGKVLAAANPESGLTLWNVADCTLIRKADPVAGVLTGFVFSPDGRIIAIESVLGKTIDAPREVILWDSAGGKTLLRIDGESFDSFAPQGPLFTTRSPDGTVKLWSLATGRAVKLGE